VNLYGLKYLYPECMNEMPNVDVVKPSIDVTPIPNQETHEMDDGTVEIVRYNPEINYLMTVEFPKIRDRDRFAHLLEFYFDPSMTDRGGRSFIWKFPNATRNYTGLLDSIIKGKYVENYVILDPITIKVIGYF